MDKTYTLTVSDTEKGLSIVSDGQGFTQVELLGLLEIAKRDILFTLENQSSLRSKQEEGGGTYGPLKED